MIRIKETNLNFEREPLAKPFGFKGGYLSNVWQTVVGLTSESGKTGVGIGTQSVLWSDSNVFAGHTEQGGNALMLALTEYALSYLKGRSFTHPIELVEELLDVLMGYGRKVTEQDSLRPTFALNALVCIDFALWLLYAREHDIDSLDELIPAAFKPALSHRSDKIASVPVVSYNTTPQALQALLDAGYFILKIKLGAPGTQREMLEQDKERLRSLHSLLKTYETPHTSEGYIPYYLDANGRYEDKETLLSLIDYADKIGALERIVIVEEPFPESLHMDVHDIDVCLAADESAHTDRDALARIEMGYTAIALKPIAKTLSMSLKIAQVAREQNIPCFCADLTVNPVLVEWNKAIAARLAPFPGIGLPMIEVNGHQNYRDWDRMKTYLPDSSPSWTTCSSGIFELDSSFYDRSSDLFSYSPHYSSLVI